MELTSMRPTHNHHPSMNRSGGLWGDYTGDWAGATVYGKEETEEQEYAEAWNNWLEQQTSSSSSTLATVPRNLIMEKEETLTLKSVFEELLRYPKGFTAYEYSPMSRVFILSLVSPSQVKVIDPDGKEKVKEIRFLHRLKK